MSAWEPSDFRSARARGHGVTDVLVVVLLRSGVWRSAELACSGMPGLLYTVAAELGLTQGELITLALRMHE